jgi:protoporphyrinogen oxidase
LPSLYSKRNTTMAKNTAAKTKRTRGKSARKTNPRKKWSARVTKTSDALDLKSKIFKSHDPKKVAKSLKRSSDTSKRKKGTPLQSAMSMLNFYMNRAGKNLPAKDKKILNEAKDELRELYGKPAKNK